MKKKILPLALTLVLMLTLVLSVTPVSVIALSDTANDAAENLRALGLFQGVGANEDGTPDFALDRAPTRQEAITMLVRLLGKEAEARAGEWETPFTDVDEWAKPYVGYAFENSLTRGTGATTFGGGDLISAAAYLTFVLRALGYDDSAGDFEWDKAWELTDELGITDGEYNAENNTSFLRGNVVSISFDVLDATMKGSEVTLGETLIEAGVFTQEDAEAVGLSVAEAAEVEDEPEEEADEPEDEPEEEIEEIPETITIKGVEYSTANLEYLILSDNQISDISALSGLSHLHYLDLNNNQVGDITALGGLTKLTELFAKFNKISDIKVLLGLTGLTDLYLTGNPLDDSQITELVDTLDYCMVIW
jgi:hypothetical protein